MSEWNAKGVAMSAGGLVMAILAIVSYALDWCSYGGGYTGYDFLLGEIGDLDTGIQMYFPTVFLILAVIMLIIAVIGLIGKGRGATPYSLIIFGFIALVAIVVFGNWTPSGVRMITDGGMGFILGMAATVVYIFIGIAGYMVRPNKPQPQNRQQQNNQPKGQPQKTRRRARQTRGLRPPIPLLNRKRSGSPIRKRRSV